MLPLAFLLLVADAAPESIPAADNVAQATDQRPLRFGLWIAPAPLTGFRVDKMSGELQLTIEYWLNPFVALKAGTGLGSASTAFFTADVGAVFDFVEDAWVIPYAEATIGMFGWLNNVGYPEAGSGRAQTAFAPVLGVGARVNKFGTSYSLGVHYRLLVDGATSDNPSRIHGLVEIRLGISFR